PTMRRLIPLPLHVLLASACLHIGQAFLIAQTKPTLSFEVATIKPSQPDTPGPLIGISASGLTLTSFTLKELMVFAYWVHPSQVAGASGWMDSDKFDIVAKP